MGTLGRGKKPEAKLMAGSSGAVEPTWPDKNSKLGTKTADGDITWANICQVIDGKCVSVLQPDGTVIIRNVSFVKLGDPQ